MASPGRILTPLCVLGALLLLAAVDPRLEPVVLLRDGFTTTSLWTVPLAALGLVAALLPAAWVGARVDRAVTTAPASLPVLERPAFRRRARWRAVEAALAAGLVLGLALGALLAIGLTLASTGTDRRALVLVGRALGKAWLLPLAVPAAALLLDLWLMRRPFWRARRGLLAWSMATLLAIGGFIALRAGAFDGMLDAAVLAGIDAIDQELQQRLTVARAAELRSDFVAAIAAYERAIDRNPARQRRHRFFAQLQDARCGLARCLARAGHKRRALAMAKLLVDDEPEWFIGQRERGRVQRLLGDAKGSEASLRRALQLCADDPETLALLVDELTLQGRSRDVVALCREQLAACLFAELDCRLGDLGERRKVMLDGGWHELELPLSGADYQLTLQCRRNGVDLPLWVEAVATAAVPRLAEPPPAPTAAPDVVALALAGGGRTRVELRGSVPAGHGFLRLRYLALPLPGADVLSNLRVAATGTVHPR